MLALMELVEDEEKFEKMRLNAGNLEIFGTFIKKIFHFSSSLNLRYTSYNTAVSDIFSESNEAFAILLLENNLDNFKK